MALQKPGLLPKGSVWRPKGDEEDAHRGSSDARALVGAHPHVRAAGFPQGHALQPGEDATCGPLPFPFCPGHSPRRPSCAHGPSQFCLRPSRRPAFCPKAPAVQVLHPMPSCPCLLGLRRTPMDPRAALGLTFPVSRGPTTGIGVWRGRCPPRSRSRGVWGPWRWRVPPHCRTPGHPSPGEGGSRDGAGQSGTQSRGGKFVKKVLNTDFPGYQKENLCIAFEFNFSIKAFSL